MTQIAPFFEGLKPSEDLTVWEWANRYRFLSSKVSASGGPFNGEKTPYMKAIYEALSPQSTYEDIVFMKSTQVAGTEAAYNLIGYHIHLDPCPIMYILPNEKLCKKHAETRFDTMVEATPVLRQKVGRKRERDGKNTQMHKDFAGGTLDYASANVADDLRSTPIRIVIMDEIAAFDNDVKGEGSPIKLAEKRTITFGNRKRFLVSSPTIKGRCLITKEYDRTDQRRFQVSCPHCAVPQFLEFENLVYSKEDYSKTTYRCGHCGDLIEERYKTKMLAAGEWIPTNSKKLSKKRIGFHINALYSPLGWLSWGKIAEDYEDAIASNDPAERKTFINTNLALPYEEDAGERPNWQRLHERADNALYQSNIPCNDVLFITAGVDVQGDRLEMVIRGWGAGKRNWKIDYRVMVGDTQKPEVWNELRKNLGDTFTRPDGVQLPIRMTCIDSGYNTNNVYDFVHSYDSTRVIAVKGRDNLGMIFSAPKAVQVNLSGKKVGKVRLATIGVSYLKAELYGWLNLERLENGETPLCYCHFTQESEHFFKSLTAEKLVVEENRKKQTFYWKREYKQNEVLDCYNYSRAAASMLGIDRYTDRDWAALAEQLKPETIPAPVAKPEAKKGGSFWDGGNQGRLFY